MVGQAGQAAAQADGTSARLSNAESEPFYFVPALSGEWLLSLGVDQRRTDGFAGGSAVPELLGVLRVGHRRYADDWGRLAAGPYAWGGLSLDGGGGHGQLGGGGLGVSAQARLMNDSFIYLSLGLFAEVGAVSWSTPQETPAWQVLPVVGLDRDQVGTRALVGVEGGFGFMGWFDPWIYGTSSAWAGVEWVDLGQASWSTLELGVQLRFDWAHR